MKRESVIIWLVIPSVWVIALSFILRTAYKVLAP
jgi:hypothetical protein